MGRPRFSHYIVTRGGKPCVLVKHEAYSRAGVLVYAAEGQEPTHFACSRDIDKYPTVYARRRALNAITRSARVIDKARGSSIAEHEFIKQVLASDGDWAVSPVLCPR